ncbi:MAG: thiaminase II [Actinomycetota bacterium]
MSVETASITAEMRQGSARIWDGLHAHPFLRELAGGTLPLEKFRFFLEQDNFYLIDYARCLAMGAAKSQSEKELRYFTVDLNQVLDAELPSNRGLLAKVIELGAPDRGGSLGMAPATLAYTSFMQSLAARGGTLEIMAALLPCAWSYVEIAAALAPELAGSSHETYAAWVGYFTLPSNVEMVGAMRTDLDALVIEEGAGPARRRELSRIFAMSSRLERSFWEMAYTLERWPDSEAGDVA